MEVKDIPAHFENDWEKLVYWLHENKGKTSKQIDEAFGWKDLRANKIKSRNDTFFVRDGELLKASFVGSQYVKNKEAVHKETAKIEETRREVAQRETLIPDKVLEFIKDENKEIILQLKEGHVVYFDFGDIESFCFELGEALLNFPEETIKLMREGIEDKNQIKDVFIKIKNIPKSQHIPINKIRAKLLGKLICIEGNTIVKTQILPLCVKINFECPSCGTIFEIHQITTKRKEPSKCTCGRRGGFKEISKDLIDSQDMIIEEQIEFIDREPERMRLLLRHELCEHRHEDLKLIGERIKIVGILKEVPRSKGDVSLNEYDYVIEVNNIEKIKEVVSEETISPADIKRIKELSKNNPLQTISKDMFKNIEGHDTIKEGLLIQQLGGVREELSDKSTRGDIHILMVGDPGTAKSDMGVIVKKIAPKVRESSGRGGSAVGLTGTAVKDEQTGRWHIEGGAMARANNGLLIIDEMDKMREEDRQSIHSGMEQQEIHINKANAKGTLITRCAVLGIANPERGSWNNNRPLLEQIDMTDTLLSRFDMIFVFKDEVDSDKDKAIAKKILTRSPEEIDWEFYKKYFIYARKINPVISPALVEKAIEKYANLRQNNTTLKKNIITARIIEAVNRISKAIAKSELCDKVSEAHIDKAFSFISAGLIGLGLSVY